MLETACGYAQLLNATQRTVACRLLCFRCLVVVILGIGVSSVFGVFHFGGRSLLGLLLLPFSVPVFLIIDQTLVDRLRLNILRCWSSGEIRLDLLADTLKGLPGIPGQTLAGLLDALPKFGSIEGSASPSLRETLAMVQRRIWRTDLILMGIRYSAMGMAWLLLIVIAVTDNFGILEKLSGALAAAYLGGLTYCTLELKRCGRFCRKFFKSKDGDLVALLLEGKLLDWSNTSPRLHDIWKKQLS